jgi:hypothetical protein
MAARSKAWVCRHLLNGIVGSNHVKYSCLRRADPLQRSPTGYDVSECNRETSIMKRPRPTRGCRATGGILVNSYRLFGEAK